MRSLLVAVGCLCGWVASSTLLGLTAFGLGPVTMVAHAGEESTSPPAVPTDASGEPLYEYRADHDPNGIGKFYRGREIAHVMGHMGALWLERPEREEEERLTLMVSLLELQPGQVVADIGAGSGVVSELLARQVLPDGRVLAVDIQQEMLDRLQTRLKERGIHNVESVLGDVKSPGLKPNTVDLVLMVDVYHEFDHPYEMAREIAAALKPGGRVALVEYRAEDPLVPIKRVHKMTEVQVKEEFGLPEFGLVWQKTVSELPRQHIVIFEKPKP